MNNLANFLVVSCEKYLKDAVTFEIIDKMTYANSNNEFAEAHPKEQPKLFKNIHKREIKCALIQEKDELRMAQLNFFKMLSPLSG